MIEIPDSGPWKRIERIGDAVLILGDCLEVLPALPRVDAIVTDPPYGVGIPYSDDWIDDESIVRKVAVPCIEIAIARSIKTMLTPGNKYAWLYPRPDDFGVWYNPAGTGFGKWGFNLAHIILYYGKCPAPKASASSTWANFGGGKDDRHPCSKPYDFSRWMVNKASIDGDVICDPFTGSCSIGVAAVKAKRLFIGIEKEEKYFDIACERITNAYRQESLFDPYEQVTQSYEQVKLL